MEHKETIIKFLDDNNLRHDDIKNIEDNNVLSRIHNLFVNDVLFEAIESIEMLNIGKYYFLKKDNDNTQKYFLMAIDGGCNMGYFWMGEYYMTNKDFENMMKYLLVGIEKSDGMCAISMGYYYYLVGDYDNVKKYLAISNTINNDNNGKIGYIYWLIGDYDNALKYYLMCDGNGDIEMTKNIGSIYSILKDYDNAKKYLLMAVDGGCVLSMYYLGLIYEFADINYEQMEKYYMMAVEGGHIRASRALKEYYETNESYIKLLNICVNYENDFTRKEIIKTFEYAMNQKSSSEDRKLFFRYLATFKFIETDELPTCLKLFTGPLFMYIDKKIDI